MSKKKTKQNLFLPMTNKWSNNNRFHQVCMLSSSVSLPILQFGLLQMSQALGDKVLCKYFDSCVIVFMSPYGEGKTTNYCLIHSLKLET